MSLELAINLFGLVLMFFALSFMLYGESLPFAIAERYYLGALAAYTTFSLYSTLRSSAFNFILAGQVWLLIPVIIGALAFARFTRIRWLARYPVAILSGIGLGLTFGLTLRGQIITMVTTTVEDVLAARPDLGSSILSFIMVFTTVAYFLYSTKYSSPFHEKSGRLYWFMRIGRLSMMFVFGLLVADIMSYQGAGQMINAMVVGVRRTLIMIIDQLH